MNTEAFVKAYNETRNGAGKFYYRRPNRKFQYSDGVQDCAVFGCYWMLDIFATELTKLVPYGDNGIIHFLVKGGKGTMRMELADDEPPVWKKRIDMTDMPDGDWVFYLVNERTRWACILPSEY